MNSDKSALGQRFSRFVIAGVVNTVGTYCIYLSLLLVFPYWVSYSISYFIGVLFAYWLNRYFVFNLSGGRYALLWIMLVYLMQFVGGFLGVFVWIKLLHMSATLAPLFSIMVMLPIVFFLNSIIFHHENRC